LTKSLLISFLALLVGGYPCLYGQDVSSKTSPKKEGSECPDDKAWTGSYRNYSYGFTIVIPEGLKAFWNSARCVSHPDGCICMQDHGRIIPLTPEPHEPERHIEAYADNGADLDKPTIKEAVKSHLRAIRERSSEKSMQIRKRSGITLAGLKGERVVVQYYDARMQAWMIEDFVTLLHDGVNYSLYLRTRQSAYENDRRTFDTLVASFTLSKRVW
jgi:hypothetical protein